ncbi:hypothetical protein OHA02_03085 [Streptomyces phaeochromogenes]|nr:hypothetical protein [Streptomyces phaeochromogenes]
MQVVIDADTRLVVATATPAAGNIAGAQAFRDTGLVEVWSGTTALTDGAYWGTGLVIPHRRRSKRLLLPIQKADNAAHRKVRARVEHAFARIQNYKILRDCRQHGDRLHHAVQAVARLHNPPPPHDRQARVSAPPCPLTGSAGQNPGCLWSDTEPRRVMRMSIDIAVCADYAPFPLQCAVASGLQLLPLTYKGVHCQ